MGTKSADEQQQLWRAVNERGPKDLGEFEAWCEVAHRRLRELVELGAAFPGELGEDAYYGAAELVTRAGEFALAFDATHLYEVCRPRTGMPPGAALVCIGRCLEYCRGGRGATERGSTNTGSVVEGLQRIEECCGQIEQGLALLVQQRTVKDAYSTGEVAELVGRDDFTVREWCRQGRIHAEKRACGRGKSQEWKISHAELLRYQSEGLLPVRKD